MILDNTDKKILGVLSANSRIPYTQLAKHVRLDRNMVKYRIDRLIKNNVIHSFETEIDVNRLGYTEYICYLGFFRFDSSVKKKILALLRKHEFVSWLGECLGKFQIKMRICAKDKNHLSKILSEIEEKCASNIRTKITMEIIDHIKEKNETLFYSRNIKTLQKTNAYLNLDKNDFIILKKLCENNKEILLSLSDETKLSIETIRNRIKRFENFGVIKGYTININHRDFGIVVWGNLLIRFKDSQKVFSKLKGFAAEKINIGRSFLLFGEWNAELGFSAESIDTLHELINDFLTKFSTDIIDYEIIFNQEGHKYPPTAQGIFKN